MTHLLKAEDRISATTHCGLSVPLDNTATPPKPSEDRLLTDDDYPKWMLQGKLFVTAKLFRADCPDCIAAAKKLADSQWGVAVEQKEKR